jgi:hypothetical protein
MNVKKELLEHIDKRKVKYISITYHSDINNDIIISGKLNKNLLDKLDFDYGGWGQGQRLDGYIWYTDGSWSERYEYDGSEWWVYKCCPEIPKEVSLKKAKKLVKKIHAKKNHVFGGEY